MAESTITLKSTESKNELPLKRHWNHLERDEKKQLIYAERKKGKSFPQITLLFGLEADKKGTVYNWAYRNIKDSEMRKVVFPGAKSLKTSQKIDTKKIIKQEEHTVEQIAQTLKRQINLSFEGLQQIIHSELQEKVVPVLNSLQQYINSIWVNIKDEYEELARQINAINGATEHIYDIVLNQENERDKIRSILTKDLTEEMIETLRGNLPEEIGKELGQAVLSEINISDQSLNQFLTKFNDLNQELSTLRQTGIPPGAIDMQFEVRSVIKEIQTQFEKITQKIEQLHSNLANMSTQSTRNPSNPTSRSLSPLGYILADTTSSNPTQGTDWKNLTLETIDQIDSEFLVFEIDQINYEVFLEKGELIKPFLKKIEQIPADTLMKVSLETNKKLSTLITELERLDDMSEEEREKLRQQVETKKAEAEAVMARKNELENALKKFKLKAESNLTSGRGVFGKISKTWAESWICKECGRTFIFRASKTQTRPRSCPIPYCGNTNEKKIERYDPGAKTGELETQISEEIKESKSKQNKSTKSRKPQKSRRQRGKASKSRSS
ncbi:MAG: hypothetical protein ACFFCZ_27045 [Promethearchaeota archaeon]